MTIVPDRSVADATNSDILYETNYNLEDLNAHIERDEPRLVPDQRSVYNEIVQRSVQLSIKIGSVSSSMLLVA